MPATVDRKTDAAGGGLSATQRMAYAFNSVAPDWMTALYGIDEFCEYAHRPVSLSWGADQRSAPVWGGVTGRHIWDGSRPSGWTGF